MAQNTRQDPTWPQLAMAWWNNLPLVLKPWLCACFVPRAMLDAGGDRKMKRTAYLPSGGLSIWLEIQSHTHFDHALRQRS